MVPVVEPTLFRLLVLRPGEALSATMTHLPALRLAAVDLAAVTLPADEEDLPAPPAMFLS